MKKISLLFLTALFLISGMTLLAKDPEVVVTDRSDNSAFIGFISDESLRYMIILRKDDAKPAKPLANIHYKSFKRKVNIKDLEKLDVANTVFYDGVGNFSGTVEGLEPNTHYTLELFTGQSASTTAEFAQETKLVHFSTFAAEPSQQANSIAFRAVTEHQIEALWANGNGKGRIVVVKKDKQPDAPKDGVEYTPGKFGSSSCIIPGTESFVVYNSSRMQGARIKVDSLESGKYYFHVFEYNGKDETINYNTSNSKNNPRYKVTLLAAPKALPATNVTKNSFTANWEKYPDVKHYELDVAKDENFTEYVDTFQYADIGDVTSIEIKDLENDVYYYRIKAFVQLGDTEVSNVIKVEMQK